MKYTTLIYIQTAKNTTSWEFRLLETDEIIIFDSTPVIKSAINVNDKIKRLFTVI